MNKDKQPVIIHSIYLDQDTEYTPLQIEEFYLESIKNKEFKDAELSLFYKISSSISWDDDDSACSNLELTCYRWETDVEQTDRIAKELAAEEKAMQIKSKKEADIAKLKDDPEFALYESLSAKFKDPCKQLNIKI